MSNESPHNPTLREWIDACPLQIDARLGGEFAVIWEKFPPSARATQQLRAAQSFDRRLAAALTHVPVPVGAQQNLLARLTDELSKPNASLPPAPLTAEGAVTQLKLSERATPWPRRIRTWSRWAVAACMLVAAMVAAWSWRPAARVDVISLAEHWQTNLGDTWQPFPPGPKKYPLPSDLAYQPRGWQQMVEHGGYRGVAYNYSRPGAAAVLFVVRVVPDQQLPARPPRMPQYSAGGRLMAAWIADKWLCLLVMDGNQRAYESLLRGRSAPLAYQFPRHASVLAAAAR